LSIKTKIVQLSADVCASIPYTLDALGPSKDQLLGRNLYGVNTFAWILYPVAEDKYNPLEMRKWTLATLHRVAEKFGIQYVRLGADLVTARIDVSDYQFGYRPGIV